ncbi:MAG TPA: preprotein translocase subunit SecA [Elusimicrobiota bacterium]|nr:preprotein translocase subunit SecA [Elusimicrobiota bacterium]
MLKRLFESFFGTSSERRLKKYQPIVDRVNALDAEVRALPDEAFPQKTAELKKRLEERLAPALENLPKNEDERKKAEKDAWQEALDELLPEAFALTREAARRTIGLRHYDVQIMGGIILHEGSIAEMRTGEGKTLVATAPVYLNALLNRGVHLITVNDYLAKRDCEWMGPVYKFLGLSVGFVQHDHSNEERRAAYACDVTYVTNNEVGFDYLRDNMIVRKEDRVMRPLQYAIIDEVDSILIDEARTPLIISGAAEKSTDRYAIINRIMPSFAVRQITEDEEIQAKYTGEDLGKGYDAIVDEKNHTAVLTETGIDKAEKLLGIPNLYDDLEGEWVHHITQALRAHHLYDRDVDYVVKDGEVVIVDEFTGRLMPGRRWSEGLHQAVEAKENLAPKEENQTLATITFQNFFKLYRKMSGMTGTAMTEEDEFLEIYQIKVCEIPTHNKSVREDFADLIYRSEKEKYAAILDEIKELWKKGRPVLVGTRSIEKSEKISGMLRTAGVPHQVLNAKYHEMEAQIIAQAGRKAGVTIATNMAGRGTDILLGGNPQDQEECKQVLALGGLHVLGTERHESRRIDNQLRGRCGRQGDPGSTRFYLALDDELLRLFGGDRLAPLMERLGMKEGEVIESRLVSRQIESAQRRVETHNFDIRKQLLDYDNVMNKQREVVYKLRNEIIDGESTAAQVDLMVDEELDAHLAESAPAGSHSETWDLPALKLFLERLFGLSWDPAPEELQTLDPQALRETLLSSAKERYAERRAEFEAEGYKFSELEKMILLQMIDRAWKGHLYDLDHLKKSIGLRGYAQLDPKVEYQKESFRLFEAMLARIRAESVEYLFKVEAPKRVVQPVMAATPAAAPGQGAAKTSALSGGAKASALSTTTAGAAALRPGSHIGRNDPCYCGSGKKYKKCHGA